MKRSIKTSLGVTLLEIMLVLVIASLVLVMSIRYYQSATNSQRVNAAVNIVTGVIAAADTYQSSTGSFTSMTSSSIAPYMPNSTMPNSPWGAVRVNAAGSGLTYTVNISLLPAGVCTQIANLIKTNTKVSTDCTTANNIVITYDSSK